MAKVLVFNVFNMVNIDNLSDLSAINDVLDFGTRWKISQDMRNRYHNFAFNACLINFVNFIFTDRYRLFQKQMISLSKEVKVE